MQNNRNPGLDVIRIASMALVFAAHSSVFSTNWGGFFGLRYTFGEVGLTSFLVLSGYLLGVSVFRDPDSFHVGKFYVNRFIRILPAYYVALIFTAILNHSSIPPISFALLQNYNKDQLSFMPTSWSLCIEEWTYIPLMLLFLLLLLFWRKDRGKAFLVAVVLILVTALVLRLIYLIQHPGSGIDFKLRKRTQFRMDTFALGMLASWLEYKHKAVFDKVLKNLWVNLAALIGLIGSMAMWYVLLDGSENPVFKYLVFTVLPIFTLFFVLRIKDLPVWKKPFFEKAGKPLALLSALTYPAYLVHFQFYILVSNYCNDNLVWHRALPFILTLLMTFGWALAVHLVVEKPMNFLRRKLMSVSFRKAQK